MDLASKNALKFTSLNILFIVFFLFIAFGAIFPFVGIIDIFRVSGNSMNPTLKNNDTVFIKIEKQLKNEQIIFLKKPVAWDKKGLLPEGKILVKRLKAHSGDTIRYDGKSFFINEEKFFSHTTYPCNHEPLSYKLKKDEILIAGDNIHNSLDSRKIFCTTKDNFLVDTKEIVTKGRILFHVSLF